MHKTYNSTSSGNRGGCLFSAVEHYICSQLCTCWVHNPMRTWSSHRS
jgi:hypothetical protein